MHARPFRSIPCRPVPRLSSRLPRAQVWLKFGFWPSSCGGRASKRASERANERTNERETDRQTEPVQQFGQFRPNQRERQPVKPRPRSIAALPYWSWPTSRVSTEQNQPNQLGAASSRDLHGTSGCVESVSERRLVQVQSMKPVDKTIRQPQTTVVERANQSSSRQADDRASPRPG